MLRTMIAVLVVLIPQSLLSQGNGFLNLTVPTGLEEGQAEFIVQHRFFGKITEDPLDTFFGIDSGANVRIGLRMVLREDFGLVVSHIRMQKEYEVGLSYTCDIPHRLRTQGDVRVFSFKPGVQEREHGIFCQWALVGAPVLGRVTPALNLGYDSYEGSAGLGFGFDVALLERLSLIGEYFPVLDGNGLSDCFALGINFRTYGHRFMLLSGNSSEIGTRRLMRGTGNGRDLYFGFNIRRLLFE
ncbi:MAG: DUF5777 family beta-barrel protein [Candidatus Latescibacterota bacterium]